VLTSHCIRPTRSCSVYIYAYTDVNNFRRFRQKTVALLIERDLETVFNPEKSNGPSKKHRKNCHKKCKTLNIELDIFASLR
jgi:hypothetical protein